jgi:hypothetical protein
VQSWRLLKKRAQAGEIGLYFLDQSVFAPTLPTGYAWVRKGQRKTVDHQASQGRRVNVVAALCHRRERLVFECRSKSEGRYDGLAHLAFVRRVKREAKREACPDRPCVIVLDNYSVHRSGLVKAEMPALAAEGIEFFFLPAYCPWLNEIEPLWRQVKDRISSTRTCRIAVTRRRPASAQRLRPCFRVETRR